VGIQTFAGPELEQYCRRHSPIALGEAVVTPGFELPNPYVIHARAAMLSFLPIHPSDCALSEDGSNDGHGTWFRLCVDSILWVRLHAAGSSGFMKPQVCLH
jgi:hypothetical protein